MLLYGIIDNILFTIINITLKYNGRKMKAGIVSSMQTRALAG